MLRFHASKGRHRSIVNHSGAEAAGSTKSPSEELVAMLPSRDSIVQPSFLRWLYNTNGYVTAASDRNVLAIVGQLNDYSSPTDLKAFMSKYLTEGAAAAFTVIQVKDGGYDTTHLHTEASVDTQYATAMAFPIQVFFYSTGNWLEGEIFFSWLGYIIQQNYIPPTISILYAIDEKVTPREYQSSCARCLLCWDCDYKRLLIGRRCTTASAEGIACKCQ